MGQKHKEPTGLTLHILCLYFSHTGDVAPPIYNFLKRPFSDKNGAKVRKIPETHKETQKK